MVSGAVQCTTSQVLRPFLLPPGACSGITLCIGAICECTWRYPRSMALDQECCHRDECALLGTLGRLDEALSLAQPIKVEAVGEITLWWKETQKLGP